MIGLDYTVSGTKISRHDRKEAERRAAIAITKKSMRASIHNYIDWQRQEREKQNAGEYQLTN